MDPEHASITGRLFFSRVEKNQKTKGRKLRSFHRSKRTKRPRAQDAFFSQVEKNQKTKGRGEKLLGEGGRAVAERQNSLRSDTAAP